MPVSLFCIFAYYSKDICFDMLLAPFWIKWDGFRIYLKRFKLLFIDSSIVHQTFLSHAHAVLSIENTKTTKTRSLSFWVSQSISKRNFIEFKKLVLFCFWSFPFSWFFKTIFLALLKSCNGCNVKCFGKPGRAGKAQIMFIFFYSLLDYIILFPSTPPWSPYIYASEWKSEIWDSICVRVRFAGLEFFFFSSRKL